MFDRRRGPALITVAAAAVTLAAAGLVTAVSANAATGCRVVYTIQAQWGTGFTTNVVVTNLGDPITTWALRFSLAPGEIITQGWGAVYGQSGQAITGNNESWNGPLATGGSTSIGFNANSTSPATVPSSFTLNGTTCTGATNPNPTTATQPAPPTTNPPSPSPPPPNPPPSSGLVGWATQGGGTTGGGNGPTVTVTSLAALTTAAASTTAQTIRVSGAFTCSADVRVASNKTILGVGAASGLNGCGLNIRDVSNVIVRNMRIANVQAGNGNGDAIHIDHATRLWIDHNDLSSDTTHGTDFYDGLIDITHAADFVTVSWNYLHNHIKCSLLGHSDSNAAEDVGHLRVTYHHNRFDGCDQRNPRVRFGNPVHVYNNYYNGNGSYGVASTIQGGVLVEGNYFENVEDPFHVGEGSSPPGTLVARNNFFVNSGAGQTSGSVGAIPYSYSLDPAANVKSIVTANAGAGKIPT